MNNGARLFGPALAGLTIAAWGVAVCFTLNAISFLAVVVVLFIMRPAEFLAVPPRASERKTPSESLATASATSSAGRTW